MAGRPPKADRDSWIRCGFDALLAEGTDSVTVDGLARTLGVTKGSFYWHFANRDALLAAVLDLWTRERTDDVIRAAEGAAEPLEALRTVFAMVGSSGPGEAALYLPRARQHPLVTAALTTVTASRVDYVAGLLRRLGHPRSAADDRARIALAVAIGFQALDQAVPAQRTDDVSRRRATMLALELIHRGASAPGAAGEPDQVGDPAGLNGPKA